jgi:glycosyltransferase involved in cell wall biosynthesis
MRVPYGMRIAVQGAGVRRIEMPIVTCQFSDSYYPIMDGVSLTVANYLSELNRTLGPAYAVVPVVPGYADRYDSQTFRFFSFPLIRRPPYRFGLPQVDVSLQWALRTRSFDLLHAHSPFLAGRFALKLARQRGIPIVATFHSKYREKMENLIPRSCLAERILVDPVVEGIVDFYESVDQVWVPTEAAVETLREYGYRGTVEVVRHGIDFPCPGDTVELRATGEKLLSLDRQDFLFLYVGDHAWEKNLAFLLQALSLLKRGGCRFKMALVGEGYAAKPLRLMSAHLGLNGVTAFVGVLRDRSALAACYARADCFLFPSLYDTCGLVVREAAAFGVPSVVLNSSAAAEQIVDGRNGFVSGNTVQAYTEKLRLLLGNRSLLRRVGEGARATLCVPWAEAVQEVKARYLSLLGRSSAAAAGSQGQFSMCKEMMR